MQNLTEFISTLSHNYVFVVVLFCWIVAQMLKVVITLIQHRTFQLERLFGSGGMPSSHSAAVCSLVVALIELGQADTALFGMAVLFAIVVMHDAMGVRLESGKHARLINLLIKRSSLDDLENQKQLKELLGHTTLQVLMGALLGIVLTILFPMF